MAAEALATQFIEPGAGRGMSEQILALARARTCHTVVVGRESLSWVRERIGGELIEDLVRSGKELTVWAVE